MSTLNGNKNPNLGLAPDNLNNWPSVAEMGDLLNCVACGSSPTRQPLFQCQEGHLLCQKDGQIFQSCPGRPVVSAGVGGGRGDGAVDVEGVCGAALFQIRLQWIQVMMENAFYSCPVQGCPGILVGVGDKRNHLGKIHPDMDAAGIIPALDKPQPSTAEDQDVNNDLIKDDNIKGAGLSPEQKPNLDIEEEDAEILQKSPPPPPRSTGVPALLLQRLELLGVATSTSSTHQRPTWTRPPSPKWQGTASLALSAAAASAATTPTISELFTPEESLLLPSGNKIVQEWEPSPSSSRSSTQKSPFLQTFEQELASATTAKEEEQVDSRLPGSLYYHSRPGYFAEKLAKTSSSSLRATEEAEMLAKRVAKPDIWDPPQNLQTQLAENVHRVGPIVMMEARLGEFYRLDDYEVEIYQNKGSVDGGAGSLVEIFGKDRKKMPILAFYRELKRYQVFTLGPEFDGVFLPGFIAHRPF